MERPAEQGPVTNHQEESCETYISYILNYNILQVDFLSDGLSPLKLKTSFESFSGQHRTTSFAFASLERLRAGAPSLRRLRVGGGEVPRKASPWWSTGATHWVFCTGHRKARSL